MTKVCSTAYLRKLSFPSYIFFTGLFCAYGMPLKVKNSMKVEIKNNLYHGIPLMLRDGSQINLGSRKDGPKRRVILDESQIVPEQAHNLSRLNIISMKISKRGSR